MAKKKKIEKFIPPVGKLSPTPPGKGKGTTGVSPKSPPPPKPKPEPKPAEFLEDVRLEETIKLVSPPKEDKRVDDISKITKELLQKESESLQSKPLSPIKPKSEEDELEDIIKSPVKEVDTPQNIGGAVKIDDKDRTSEQDLIDKITKQEKTKVIKIKPVPDPIIKASELEERDRVRLEKEEEKRREIEKERESGRKEAIQDELKRRALFDAEIEQKRKEFQLFLDEKFPEFSKRNSKNLKKFSPEELKVREEERVKDLRKIESDKQTIKKEKKALQQKKVERLKKEQIRKSEEGKFKVNRVRRSEVQTFFEGDVLLEQKEKTERNPEINKETEVQIKLKEIARMEKQLGRKVVPHRDIVESEESDFDLNSDNRPDDILIVVPKDKKPLDEYNKLTKLLNIRKTLEIDKKEDIDYIKTKVKGPKEIPLFRKKRGN